MSSTDDTARELTALVSRLRRRLRDVAGFDDLTPSQTSVLARLDKDGPATASDLARAESVRPQSVAASLAVLEQRGLVVRRRDPADGRRQLVALAPAADVTIESSRRARRAWLAEQLATYTAQERRTIHDAVTLLGRLVDGP